MPEWLFVVLMVLAAFVAFFVVIFLVAIWSLWEDDGSGLP